MKKKNNIAHIKIRELILKCKQALEKENVPEILAIALLSDFIRRNLNMQKNKIGGEHE